MSGDVPCASDEELARARAGEQAAFATLVRAHQASVFSIALRMLGSRAGAEDLAQEVFLKLHRNLAAIESPAHLAYWLRRVATHRCIDRLRRQKQVQIAPLDEALELSETAGTEDPLLARHLNDLLSRLTPTARAVVLLRYQEDLDPLQIARMLEIPVNTVKSHLKRSLATLRAASIGLVEA